MNDLKRRKVLRVGDTVICDKGYYAYNNYATGVRDFKVIPLIFPKKTFDARKVLRKMNYPLSIFSHHEHRKTQQMYKDIVRKLLALLKRREDFLPIPDRESLQVRQRSVLPEGNTPIFTPLCYKVRRGECTSGGGGRSCRGEPKSPHAKRRRVVKLGGGSEKYYS